MDLRIHMTLIYFPEHVLNIYFLVPVGPVSCQDEESMAATKASKTKPDTISTTGLVTSKTEQNSR